MFRKLCGDSTLQNVVIVTDMWGGVNPQVGGAREAELVREGIFFKPVLDKGAQIARRTRYHRSRKTSPDLSQKVKVSDSLVGYAVKHETTSPVIVPVDNDQPMEDNPPTQLSSHSVSSMSTSAPAPVPAPLPAPPHLPQKPVTLRSKPPVPIQQSGRSPRRYSTQRSRSRSRSSSQRRGSPSPRMPLWASRSPDAAQGHYKSRRQANGWSTIIPHPVHLTAVEVQDMNATATAIHRHCCCLRICEKGPCRCQRTLGPKLALRASRQIHFVRCAGGRPKFVSIHSVPCRNDVRRATDPAGSVITEPFSLLHIPFS